MKYNRLYAMLWGAQSREFFPKPRVHVAEHNHQRLRDIGNPVLRIPATNGNREAEMRFGGEDAKEIDCSVLETLHGGERGLLKLDPSHIILGLVLISLPCVDS